MKCYNHHDRDAFGVCTVCGKGLCLECLNETESGSIICKSNDNCKFVSNIVNTRNKQLKTSNMFIINLLVVAMVLSFVSMLICKL